MFTIYHNLPNVLYQNRTFITFSLIKDNFFQELIADEVNIKNLNYLQYPKDYVLINNKYSINVTGEKYFANLSTTHLLSINTINNISIDDFIILSRHEVIDHEITFENLEIGGTFQVRFDKYILQLSIKT